MRERITFVHSEGAHVDPALLHIDQSGLQGPSIAAAREDRLTLSLDEIPADIAGQLPQFRELSLRWAGALAYETIEPFSSRISPGLHVTYTLADGDNARQAVQRLCHVLQSLGPLDGVSEKAFTTPGQGQSANPSDATFYQAMESASNVTAWTARHFCSDDDADCQNSMKRLSNAASLDISWDSAVGKLRISSLSPVMQQKINVRSSPERRTEIGIMSKDVTPNQHSHQVGVSGLLTVLGESKEPSGTMFSFPARHRSSEVGFSAHFLKPTGLHPILQLRLSSNQAPADDEHCAPYAYLTLPKTIFADRYQLADALFLAAKNLTASRYTSLPVDLEAPAYTTDSWGSAVLLELAPPRSHLAEAWTAQVPLHLRYLKPSKRGTVDIEIPYPAVFWACDSSADVDFANNPFDRSRLGYDGLFDKKTVFWHANPQPAAGERLSSPISVPVLAEYARSWVGLGTAATVAFGFAWVLWKLAAVFATSGYGSHDIKAKQQASSKKDK